MQRKDITGIFPKSNVWICGSLNFLWFAESSGKVLEGCKSPARVNPLQACVSVFTAVHQWFEWFLFLGMFFMGWRWLHTVFFFFFLGCCFWVCAAAVEHRFPLKLRCENACIIVSFVYFPTHYSRPQHSQENINNMMIKIKWNVAECSACLRELFCVHQWTTTSISEEFSRVIGDDCSCD